MGNKDASSEPTEHPVGREKEARTKDAAPEPATLSGGREKEAQEKIRKEGIGGEETLNGKTYPENGTPWELDRKEVDSCANNKDEGMLVMGQRKEGYSFHQATETAGIPQWIGNGKRNIR